MSYSYAFMTAQWRAQCQAVIDGDTVDLFVDRGAYDYSWWRVRLYAIDTYELRSSDPAKRQLAVQARDQMIAWLKPPADKKQVNLGTWPLRLLTYMDPDSFGRLLGEVYWTDDAGVEHHANGELLQMGLAVPYSP